MRSGTACASSATVEDNNSAGADESDPFGMAAGGSAISGKEGSLPPAGTFAMVYQATIN